MPVRQTERFDLKKQASGFMYAEPQYGTMISRYFPTKKSGQAARRFPVQFLYCQVPKRCFCQRAKERV